jgi:acyl-coenzyme A synthetase/AMP-(fatty) acid ligase
MNPNPGQEVELIERNRAEIEKHILATSLSALVAERARTFADRTMFREIEGRRRVYSFRDFNALVSRIAGAIGIIGVRRGSHVAIALPNCIEIAAIWVALSRIGAVAVGVNPALTPSELAYILDSSDSDFLVIDSGRQEWADDWSNFRITPDRLIVVGAEGRPVVGHSLEALLDKAPAAFARVDVDPDEPASILFTSGSSGMPKPALLPHLWHTMMGHVRSLQGPTVNSVLIENAIYYMGGQWRFAKAVTQGATLFVAQKPTIQHFAERIRDYGIEFSSLSNLLGKRPDFTMNGRSGLKWLASCALPKDLHAEMEAKLGAPIREIYGSTETGSTIVMPTLARATVGSGSCGLPAAWRECRTVDAAGAPVPAGAVGELEVRGPGMLLGYYKLPSATAEAFRDGWFRTGDLFRQDSDGYFYWVARVKDVIRRSNENISAVEIEEEVARIPGIVEACAVPVPDSYRGEEVKVYVRLQPGLHAADLPPDAIVQHCRAHLAAYKLPRYVQYVDEFPRTISHKISKPDLKKQTGDLRGSSYDVVDQVWR